jgi:Mlc titration factor MtfA (ptsG expression regulator)
MVPLAIAIIVISVVTYFLIRNKSKKVSDGVGSIPGVGSLLEMHVMFYKKLGAGERDKFQNLVDHFLQRVRIEGIGIDVSDLDKLLIASSAVIPIFGFADWEYKNLSSVLLYPDTFDKDFQFEGKDRSILGMVGTGYMNGQMILSRSALVRGFNNAMDRENTAIHEFVHLLDKADGAVDGLPENLLAHQYTLPWLKLMHEEMKRISAGKSDINPYALTNEAEFLAVASEYFFERPDRLQSKHPELFLLMTEIFKQNPSV